MSHTAALQDDPKALIARLRENLAPLEKLVRECGEGYAAVRTGDTSDAKWDDVTPNFIAHTKPLIEDVKRLIAEYEARLDG